MNPRTIRTQEQIASEAQEVAALPDNAVLTPAEAARFLQTLGRPLTVHSLTTYRYRKPGVIRFLKQGRAVNYLARDLRAFALGDLA